MIIHVDMDAFYASIEQRDNPELMGQPVLVGGLGTRSVVCAASYEARRFGCRSAQPMSQARRRCPSAVVLPPRFSVYRDIAQQIREIFLSTTPLVEPLSLDEAFLDVTASERALGSAVEIGRSIKSRILGETKLVASVGIAPVKFVAKLASDHEKPDGFVHVPADQVLDFLAPLQISRLWGVGKATQPKLEQLGIATIGDVRRHDPMALERALGSMGRHLWELSWGRDERPVIADRAPKSISQEETFHEDQTDAEQMQAELHTMTDLVGRRLREARLEARSAFLKIRFADFQTIRRQCSWKDPTDRTDFLWARVRELWTQKAPKLRQPVRLLGVGVSGLSDVQLRQGSLFDDPDSPDPPRVDRTVDEIRKRFGTDSVRSADSLPRDRSP